MIMLDLAYRPEYVLSCGSIVATLAVCCETIIPVVIICPTMTTWPQWLHTTVLFEHWEGNISCNAVDSLGFVLTGSEKF